MRGRQRVSGTGHDHVSPRVTMACAWSWCECMCMHIGTTVLYIEAELPDSYPSEAVPNFSLSNINNSHLSAQTKEAILNGLLDQVSRAYWIFVTFNG